jgi:hypothetical protein
LYYLAGWVTGCRLKDLRKEKEALITIPVIDIMGSIRVYTLLESTYVDLIFLATTKEALLNTDSKTELIWRQVSEPKELVSLT